MICTMRLTLISLVAFLVSGVAQARAPLSPIDILDRYEASVDRLIAAAESKLIKQSQKDAQTLQRLIDKRSSDAAIKKAMIASLNSVQSTLKGLISSVSKAAQSPQKSLQKLRTSALRTGDEETATLCDEALAQIASELAENQSIGGQVLALFDSYKSRIASASNLRETSQQILEDLENDYNALLEQLDDSDFEN